MKDKNFLVNLDNIVKQQTAYFLLEYTLKEGQTEKGLLAVLRERLEEGNGSEEADQLQNLLNADLAEIKVIMKK